MQKIMAFLAIVLLLLTVHTGTTKADEESASIIFNSSTLKKGVSFTELSKVLNRAGIKNMGQLASIDRNKLVAMLQKVTAFEVRGTSTARKTATALTRSDATILANALKSRAAIQKPTTSLAPPSMTVLK